MNSFPTLLNYEFLFLSILSNGHSHKNGHNGAHHGSSITIEHPTPPPPAASSHHFSSLSVPPMRRRRSECNTPINVSKCLESFPYVCVKRQKIADEVYDVMYFSYFREHGNLTEVLLVSMALGILTMEANGHWP